MEKTITMFTKATIIVCNDDGTRQAIDLSLPYEKLEPGDIALALTHEATFIAVKGERVEVDADLTHAVSISQATPETFAKLSLEEL